MDTSPASSTSSITYKDDSSIEDFPSPGPIPAVNESSALLPGADQSAAESQLLKPRKMTPVPKLQLAILCVARLLEPIGFTQLFPYVNEMVVKFKMIDDPSKAGFVSGLVESVFAVFQLASIYHWAKLSDAAGRRPAVLIGAIGAGIMTSLFGFSRTLPAVLITRGLHGFFVGNTAVIHSILGELSDSTNQAVMLPIYGICWPLGTIIGPILGGTFSNPADKFPLLDIPLLRQFPYAMPSLIAAAVSIFGAVLAYFLLEETHPSKRRQSSNKPKKATSYGSVPVTSPGAPLSVRGLFAVPFMRWLIISSFALAFNSTAFDAVFVLFAYTPIEHGGLGFSASQTGYSLAIAGFFSFPLQLLATPTLLRRFSCARVYHFCMVLWFLPFVILPPLNLVLRNGRDEFGEALPHARAMVWAGVVLAMLVFRTSSLAYSLGVILAKEGAPNPASLGLANGVVLMAMCVARIASPAIANSVFAASVNTNILGGHLWVVLLAGIACLGSLSSARIVKESDAAMNRRAGGPD